MTQAIPKSPALRLAALAAMALVCAPAMAAIDIYLKLGGIDGESTDDGFLKWIPLESFEVGFDSGIVTRHASGAAITRVVNCAGTP